MLNNKAGWGNKGSGSATGVGQRRHPEPVATRRYGAGWSTKFTPKKAVKSFRDLEVYQKTIECSVIIDKDIVPALEKVKSEMASDLSKNALAIPLYISEGHSLRFADFGLALGYIEKALSGCNRVSVYLDHVKGVYGEKVKADLVEDLINRYFFVRQKIFHLEQSWKKYMNQDNISSLRSLGKK